VARRPREKIGSPDVDRKGAEGPLRSLCAARRQQPRDAPR
jgi:hypothetical protein